MKQSGQPSTQQVSCLLMDGFSTMACASATEPFLACNRLNDRDIYQLEYLSYGNKVISDTGQVIQPHINLSESPITKRSSQKHLLILCGGTPVNYPNDDKLLQDLPLLKQKYKTLAGIGTGSFCLARSGLLDNKKSSVHWWSLSALREQFPNILFSTDLFSIDGNIATCRGSTAAQDLMFMLISQYLGSHIIEGLSQYFLKERIGISGERIQRLHLNDRQKQEQPKLVDAITLMENNIEEPLSTDTIASHLALSTRQLERLFKKYLNTPPSRYYLLTRLEKAREQLLNTEISITQIAHECGFSSTAHFSTHYRNLFGFTPTEDRAMKE